ncbi:MAG: ABC transporter ATP-binding protein [Dehalococcoidia bacterium]
MNMFRKVLDLLTPKERRLLWVVFAGVLTAALLETAGVASILPFLTLVASPDAVTDNAIVSWLFNTLGFTDVNRFLLFLGVGAVAVLIVSNALRAAVMWGMLRFSWGRNHSISRRLLAGYLHRPYTFFLNENTAILGRNILGETGQLVNGILVPGIEMLARAVVLIFILALLIAVDPVLAPALFLSLGLVYGAIYLFARRRLGRIGSERIEANAGRYKTANEAFGGIKLVKLLGAEEGFVEQYSRHSWRFATRTAAASVISRVPQYALETVAFGGIMLIVVYLLGTGGDLAQVLPLAGLFVFAGGRIMPAMQHIFHGMSQLRFNTAVLDTLHEALRESGEAAGGTVSRDVEPLPFKERLELQNTSFRYPGTTEPVIHGVSVTIKAGSSVAFVGTTGAGKTTIGDIILGLLPPSEGSMRADGVEITDENIHRWQRNLGYVPQDIYLQDNTVASNIAFGTAEKDVDMEAVERAARIAKIHDFIVNELPQGYRTTVGERGVRLSGGERQRVGIARALYHNPEVLVLDEATSALDGATERAVFAAIESVARVKTLIIIAHRLSTVRNCDVVYVLEHGRIVARGTYDELMESSARFQEMAKGRG